MKWSLSEKRVCNWFSALLQWMHPGNAAVAAFHTPKLGAVHVQAAAVLDKVARMVLPLLLRGMRLRSDALSGIMDDIYQPRASSSELHVIRYRGPIDGEELLNLTVRYAQSNR